MSNVTSHGKNSYQHTILEINYSTIITCKQEAYTSATWCLRCHEPFWFADPHPRRGSPIQSGTQCLQIDHIRHDIKWQAAPFPLEHLHSMSLAKDLTSDLSGTIMLIGATGKTSPGVHIFKVMGNVSADLSVELHANQSWSVTTNSNFSKPISHIVPLYG